MGEWPLSSRNCWNTAGAGCMVKLGGMLGTDTTKYGPGAKKAFELANAWASTHQKGYSLDMTGVAAYNATTMATHIAAQTAAGAVHAVICPYTSGASGKCVDAVDANFK